VSNEKKSLTSRAIIMSASWRLDLNNHPNNVERYIECVDYIRENIRGRDKSKHLTAILQRLSELEPSRRKKISIPVRTSFERKMVYKFCEDTGYTYTKHPMTEYKHECKSCGHRSTTEQLDCYYSCGNSRKYYWYRRLGIRPNLDYHMFTLTPPIAKWKKSVVRDPLVDLGIPPAIIVNCIYPYLPDVIHS